MFYVDTDKDSNSTEELDEGSYVGEEHWCWEAHFGYAGCERFHSWSLAEEFAIAVVDKGDTEHETKEEEAPVCALFFGTVHHKR